MNRLLDKYLNIAVLLLKCRLLIHDCLATMMNMFSTYSLD